MDVGSLSLGRPKRLERAREREQLTCDMKYHKMKHTKGVSVNAFFSFFFLPDNFLLFPESPSLRSLVQSSSSFSLFFRGEKRETALTFLRKKQRARITRQSTKIKDRKQKKERNNVSFHFIINILFKLRCYCCQNCNFHNEFQVLSLRTQGLWNGLFRWRSWSEVLRDFNEKPVSISISLCRLRENLFRFLTVAAAPVKCSRMGKKNV